MNITQRQVSLALLLVQTVGVLLLTIYFVLISDFFLVLITGISGLIFSGLFVVYWKGWEYARHITVIFITLLSAISLQEPFISEGISFVILLPSVFALILVRPIWVIGSALIMIFVVLTRANFSGIYTNPQTIFLYIIIVFGMVLSRFIADAAQRAAEANAEQAIVQARLAEQKAHEADQKAIELAHTSLELAQQNEAQRRLLELVSTLETPVVTLTTGVLLAPIVGHLDSQRADKLTNRLLHITHDQRPRMVIIDIAGVAVVDTAVARALIQTVEALRLLGCQVAITGISAAVATTITSLNISFDEVQTARSPQEILNVLGKTSHPRNNLALHTRVSSR